MIFLGKRWQEARNTKGERSKVGAGVGKLVKAGLVVWVHVILHLAL